MLKNSNKLKIHNLNKMQIIRFRVNNFEFIRIQFNLNTLWMTKDYPVIEVSEDGVDFARHLKNGVTYSKKVFKEPFIYGRTYDFFIVMDGSKLLFGTFEKLQFRTVGFYFYDELDTLPYIGFSSINKVLWILENSKIIANYSNLNLILFSWQWLQNCPKWKIL